MSALVECPEHSGAYDCTPFCPRCHGEQEYAAPTPPEALAGPWAIGDDNFLDLACEACAREFATARGLTWEFGNMTRESSNGHAHEIWLPHDLERDTPAVCACGVLLDTALTSDGVEYVREHYPANWWHLWGVEA